MSFDSHLDVRTVEMRFENKEFEKGIQETLKSLNLFDKTLNVLGTARKINTIIKTINKISDAAENLGNVASNIISKISSGVSGMIGNLVRMANQVSAGMSKYETLMSATRSMMNATGKSVEEINEVMEELNRYTDETSYEFTQLSSSMSSLISSGRIKDLSKAEKVMEGMANAAAHAGIGIGQASGPIEVLTKAMSKGKMQSRDWYSLSLYKFISPQFRKQLIESAKALGVLDEKGMFKTSGGKKVDIAGQSIENTLHYGWMTSDVIAGALEVYADRTTDLGKAAFASAREAKTFSDVLDYLKDVMSTGWMKSFEYLFGNVTQAASLFTWLAESIGEVVESVVGFRNDLLSGWNEKGGRDTLVDTFVYLWETIKETGSLISDAFTNIFNLPSVDGLVDFTNKVHDAIFNMYMWLGGNAAKEGDKIAPRFVMIRQAFEGLFSVLSFGRDIVKGFFGLAWNVISTLFGSSDSFLLSIGSLGRTLKGFFDTIKKNGNVPKFFEEIWNIVKPMVVSIKDFASAVFDFIGVFLGLDKTMEKSSIAEKFNSMVTPIKIAVKTIVYNIKKFFQIFTTVFKYLAGAKDTEDLKNRIELVMKSIRNTLKNTLTKMLKNAVEWVKKVWPTIKEHLISFKDSVIDWLFGVSDDIKKNGGGMLEKLGAWFADTWKNIRKQIKKKYPELDKLMTSIEGAATSVWDFVSSFTGLDKVLGKNKSSDKTSLFDKIKNAVIKASEYIRKFLDAFSKIVKTMSPAFMSIRNFVLSLINFGSTLLRIFGIFDGKKTGKGLETFANTLSKVFDVLTTVFNYLAEAKNLEDLKKRIGTILEKIATYIVSVLFSIIVRVNAWIQEDWPKVKESLIKSIGEFIPKLIDFLKKTFPRTTEFITRIVEWFNGLFPGISSSINSLFGNAESTTSNAVDNFLSFAFGLFEKIKNWILDKIEWVTSFIGNLSLGNKNNNPFSSFFTNMFSKGEEKASSVKDMAVGFFSNFMSNGSEYLASATESGKDFVSGIGSGIDKYGNVAVDAIENLVTNLIDKARNIADMHSPSKVMIEFGKNLVLGVGIGIEKYSEKAENAGSNMITDVLGSITGGSGTFEKIGSFAGDAATTIAEIGKIDKGDLQDGVDVFGFISQVVTSIKDIIFEILDVVKQIFSSIKWLLEHPFSTIFIVLIAALPIIVGYVRTIVVTIGKLRGVVAKKSTVAQNLLMLGVALGAIIFALAALNAVATPGEIWSSVAAVLVLVLAVTGIAMALDAFNNMTKKVSSETALDRMRSLAFSIAGIVASLVLLVPSILFFSIISAETFFSAFWKISIIVGGLSAILALVSNLSSGGEGSSIGGTIGLVIGVVGLIGAFLLLYFILNSMKTIDFVKATAAAVGVISFVLALGKAVGNAKDVKAGPFLSLAVTIYALVMLFEVLQSNSGDLASEINTDIMLYMVQKIIETMGEMIKKSSSVNKKSLSSLSLVFVSMGVMIYSVGVALKKAKGVPWTASVPMMAGIALMIYELSYAINSAKKASFASLSGLAVVFAGVSVLIVAAAFALSLIPSSVSWQLVMAFMTGITLLILASSLVINKAKGSKVNWSSIGGIVVVLAAIAGFIAAAAFTLTLIPTNVNWGVVAAFLGGLAAMLLAVSLVTFASTLTNIQALGGVAIMMLGIAVLAVAAGFALSLIPANIKWETILSFFGGLVLMLLAVAVVTVTSILANILSLAGVVIVMLGVAALAIASAYAISLIPKDVSWKTILAFFGGMALMLVAISLVVLLSTTSNIVSLIGVSVLMLGISVLAIASGYALSKVPKDMPWESILAFFGGLAVLLIAASVAALIASIVPLAGIIKIAVIVLALGVVVSALALLASIVGELVAGAFVNIMNDFSTAMGICGNTLNDFNENTKDINKERIEIVLSVIEDIIGEMVKLIGQDYTGVNDFSVNLNRLGVALRSFNNRLSEIDRNAINEKLKIVDDIKTAAEKINSIPNIGDMSETIANIGGAIKLYYESLSGIDMQPKDANGNPIDITNFDSNGFIEMFRSIANQMPDQGDLEKVTAFADKSEGTSLSMFAVGITNLSTALTTFSNEMAAADQRAILNGVKNLKQFAEIQKALPVNGEFDAFYGFFHGKQQTMGEFALDIETVGGALSSFATDIGGALTVIDENSGLTNMDVAISAAERMKDLGNALPKKDNALFAWFSGKQMSLAEFGTNLSTLGDGLNKFVVKAFADGITYEKGKFDGIADLVSTFVEIQNKISKKEHGNALNNFATYLSEAGTGIQNFNKNAMYDSNGKEVQYNIEKLEGLAKIVDIFVQVQNKIIKKDTGNAINDFARWLNESSGNFKTFFENASKWTIDKDKLWAIAETANAFAEAFGNNFGDETAETLGGYSSETIIDAMMGIIDRVAELFADQGYAYNKMAEAGHYIDLGLTKGINEYSYHPINAIGSVTNGIIDRAREVALIMSPSRVMAEIGMWLDKGLGKGIDDYAYNPANSAEEMAHKVEEAVRDSLGVHSISDIFKNIGKYLPLSIGEGWDGSWQSLWDNITGKCNDLTAAVGDILNGGDWTSFASLLTGIDEGTIGNIRTSFEEGGVGAAFTTWLSSISDSGTNSEALSGLQSIVGAFTSLSAGADYVNGMTIGDVFDFENWGSDINKPQESRIDTARVDDLLGEGTGSSSLGRSSSRSSSESSNLGKQTTTVSSGGLNISMTDGYTIGDILNRIDRLETAITNMQIVLDTGILAGQVASGVDKELGTYATMNGRWN